MYDNRIECSNHRLCLLKKMQSVYTRIKPVPTTPHPFSSLASTLPVIALHDPPSPTVNRGRPGIVTPDSLLPPGTPPPPTSPLSTAHGWVNGRRAPGAMYNVLTSTENCFIPRPAPPPLPQTILPSRIAYAGNEYTRHLLSLSLFDNGGRKRRRTTARVNKLEPCVWLYGRPLDIL